MRPATRLPLRPFFVLPMAADVPFCWEQFCFGRCLLWCTQASPHWWWKLLQLYIGVTWISTTINSDYLLQCLCFKCYSKLLLVRNISTKPHHLILWNLINYSWTMLKPISHHFLQWFGSFFPWNCTYVNIKSTLKHVEIPGHVFFWWTSLASRNVGILRATCRIAWRATGYRLADLGERWRGWRGSCACSTMASLTVGWSGHEWIIVILCNCYHSY